MKDTNEQEFIREYNQVYGKVVSLERKKRGLTLEQLSSGIMSRTTLEKVEKGAAQWTKMEGDILMLRMGIPPEYFESLASGEELERWRLREDICLLVPGRPEEAAGAINRYRLRYKKRGLLEEQFLLKAEAVLMLVQQKASFGEAAAAILDTALQAVSCTVRDGWRQGLAPLCLSPGELEAILLVSAALFGRGDRTEAWRLWAEVWDYPGKHKWKERTTAMILPQAAILGIRMASVPDGLGEPAAARGVTMDSMAARGRKALEMLRRNGSHCYALPLLDCLCGLDASLFGEPEYLERVTAFRQMFLDMYAWFGYPGYRIWQGISVDNTRDAGMTLKMLRTFYGKSRESAVYDKDGLIVTPRQLERIEKGLHKPSYYNYGKLVRQYGKFGRWNMPLLETDSLEVLEQRQLISRLMENERWEQAEWEIRKFRSMVNAAYPKVKQELLFFDAVLKKKKGGDLRECLEMLLEALRCTVPDFGGKDMKWWVYQREEIMIASNIGSSYRRLGNFDEAQKWFEAVLFSVGQLSERTGICNYGFDVVAEGYDNYLGDIRSFNKAIKLNEETAWKDLLIYRINGTRRLFYRIAWNTYEENIEKEKPEEYEFFRLKWRKAFMISKEMADFMYDTHLSVFLEKRVDKFVL